MLLKDSLVKEILELKGKIKRLKKRLRQPQDDISNVQWQIMHRQLHSMEKYYSCLHCRIKDCEK